MDSLLYQIYSGEYEFTPDREEKQPALYAQLDKTYSAAALWTACWSWRARRRTAAPSKATGRVFVWASG